MKCQACDKAATLHVTELVGGHPVEYHVCEAHFQNLEALQPKVGPTSPTKGLGAFWTDAGLRVACNDRLALEKTAAYLLPALCLALLDEKPEVRVMAAYRLTTLGSDARSALGALEGARHDPDERVRKAVEIALECIRSEEAQTWLF
jgi:hypothetical protein